jgi:TRAP-type C4-dicarboxylate transport system permease small subunit
MWPLRKLIYRLSGASGLAATLILAAMTAAVIYEVVMRDLFNAPTVWSVEFTGYGMAWLGLLSASDVLRRSEHVGIRLLSGRLTPGVRAKLYRFVNALVCLTALVLTFASCRWVLDAYRISEVSDTVLQTPLYIVRIVFPVGMILVALVAAARVVEPADEGAR